MNYTGNVKIDTIIRTVVLVVCILNQVLAVAGKEKLPIYESDVAQIISTAALVVSSLWAWWKNNSFTKAAIQGDAVKDELKTYEDENGGF